MEASRLFDGDEDDDFDEDDEDVEEDDDDDLDDDDLDDDDGDLDDDENDDDAHARRSWESNHLGSRGSKCRKSRPSISIPSAKRSAISPTHPRPPSCTRTAFAPLGESISR